MGQKQILAAGIALLAVLTLFYFRRKPGAPAAPSSGVPALAKKWEFATGGKISSALALADDGTVYAASEDGSIYALDESGITQWKAYVGATRSAPAIGADGAIYISNNNGRVFALNHSGVVRWSSTVYGGNTLGENGAALGRDYLYFPSRGDLVALRLTNGQTDWSSRWGGEQRGSVTLLPDGTILSPGRGRLNALNSRGEMIWQYPPLSSEAVTRNGGYPPPGDFFVGSGIAFDNNRTLYAAVARSRMVAMGLDGTLKWEVNTNGNELSRATPVISADGTIIFGSSAGTLYAVDSLGTTKWTLSLQSPLRATPVLAQDGTIFVLDGRDLSAVSSDGHLLSKVEIGPGGESSPTLAPDGTVYVATYDGKVIAFAGGHGGLMNSPWPKYQADLSNSGNPRSF